MSRVQTRTEQGNKPRLQERLPLGRTLMTRAVADLVASGKVNPLPLIARHSACDWGDVCAEDWCSNNRAVRGNGLVLSSYEVSGDLKVWIITEWDRSVTTLLLPSDY